MLNKKLSIIISVYNEEEVLHQFFAAFDQMEKEITWPYELIFVNDGSKDKSLEYLKEYCAKNSNAKLLSFSRNFGHEAAMIAGIDYASGDGLICMDADLQHPLSCIPQIIEQFELGYEVVNMVRLENKSAGILKNITSSMFYKVVNALADKTKFEENASDFFAMSSKVAEVLRTNYREKTRFLRGYVQNVGFRSTCLEYVAADRVGGASHYNFKTLYKFSMNAILSFSNVPLKAGIYAAVMSALFGIITLIYTLVTYKGAPDGYTTIVVLISFLFAVLFMIIGIIGQYLAVLFTELKDRPIYIVEDTVNFEVGRVDLKKDGGINE